MKKKLSRGRGLSSSTKTGALTGAGCAVVTALMFEGGKWIVKKTREAKAPNPPSGG